MRKFIVLFLMLLCYESATSQIYTLYEKWVDCGNGCKLLDPYYKDGVTFSWTGDCVNGKADGYGKAVKYVNGEYESTYEGYYKNGIREGKGKFSHKDGTIKYGDFENGQLMGYGTMESDDGLSYEGNFINYRFHGKGKVKLGNGTTFEGYFVSDSPYTGKFVYYDGTVILIQEGVAVDKIEEKHSGYKPKIGERVTEYFDEDWNRCEPGDAAYYRLITYEEHHKPLGEVRDYYITGELQGKCQFVYVDYDDEGKNFVEGEMVLYHKNGKIKEEATYMNSKLNGFYSEYYENGNLKTRQFFNSGVPDGDLIGYYENGNPSIIAKYDNGTLLNNKYVQFEDDGSCFLIYEENFLRNANAWMYEGQNGNITINDTGDYITLNAAPGRTVSGGIDTGFSQDSENIIEFFVSQNSEPNSSVGILFGFKDWHNYCALYIGRDQYLFRYIKNGEQMTDEHWEYSKYIEKDANKITIVNTQEALNILINDMVVWQSQSFQYDGTFCGVTADNNGTGDAIVNLGRLSVYELVTDERVISQYLPNKQYGDWAGNGSGFFLTEDGYLATNYHVVEDANAIEVTFVRNGVPENYPATVVMSDKQNDLSILKISDDGFKEMPPIPYNITTTVRDTGSEVFTLGYPIADVMGTEVKFTDGKISSKTGMQGDVTVYQISVPIQPGNSGGPLFDSEGNLIGITSSALNREYFKSENVNYAIKSSYLKALVDVLPGNIKLQTSANISSLPLTEKIKLFQPYMLYIKVK